MSVAPSRWGRGGKGSGWERYQWEAKKNAKFWMVQGRERVSGKGSQGGPGKECLGKGELRVETCICVLCVVFCVVCCCRVLHFVFFLPPERTCPDWTPLGRITQTLLSLTHAFREPFARTPSLFPPSQPSFVFFSFFQISCTRKIHAHLCYRTVLGGTLFFPTPCCVVLWTEREQERKRRNENTPNGPDSTR